MDSTSTSRNVAPQFNTLTQIFVYRTQFVGEDPKTKRCTNSRSLHDAEHITIDYIHQRGSGWIIQNEPSRLLSACLSLRQSLLPEEPKGLNHWAVIHCNKIGVTARSAYMLDLCPCWYCKRVSCDPSNFCFFTVPSSELGLSLPALHMIHERASLLMHLGGMTCCNTLCLATDHIREVLPPRCVIMENRMGILILIQDLSNVLPWEAERALRRRTGCMVNKNK